MTGFGRTAAVGLDAQDHSCLTVCNAPTDVFTQTSLARTPRVTMLSLSNLLIAVLVLVCMVILSGVQPPLWIQPTIVGLFWGSTALCGLYLGVFGRSRFSSVLIAVGLSILLNLGCIALTNLDPSDCLLINALLVGSGWLKGRLGTPDLKSGNTLHACDDEPWHTSPDQSGSKSTCNVGRIQWSIGDLATITALSACVISATMQLSFSPLLMSVGWAFLVGLVCCWLAYRWVWIDRWSMSSIGIAIFGIMVAIGYVDQYAPSESTWWESFAWLCAGPISVVASQATTVLLFLAVVRFENEFHSAHSALRNESRRPELVA